jgi:(p)ppGpp synthase/HD superfamily hydrolase
MGAKSNLNKYLKNEQRSELIKKATTELNIHLEKNGLPKIDSPKDKFFNIYTRLELERKFMEILDRKNTYSQLIKSVYPVEREIQNKNTNSFAFQSQLQQVKDSVTSRIMID